MIKSKKLTMNGMPWGKSLRVDNVHWTSDPACRFCPAHIFTPTILILARGRIQPICWEKEGWTHSQCLVMARPLKPDPPGLRVLA